MKLKTSSLKWVGNYEGSYKISSEGTVFSYLRGKVKKLQPAKDRGGYPCVSLAKEGKKKTFKIHRIVAEAFIPNHHSYPCVNHIDGDKENNSVGNLEWCTHKQNNIHAMNLLGRHGSPFGGSVRRKLDDIQVLTVLTWVKSKSVNSIAAYYNVTPESITMIKRFKTYKNLTSKIIDAPILELNRFSE